MDNNTARIATVSDHEAYQDFLKNLDTQTTYQGKQSYAKHFCDTHSVDRKQLSEIIRLVAGKAHLRNVEGSGVEIVANAPSLGKRIARTARAVFRNAAADDEGAYLESLNSYKKFPRYNTDRSAWQDQLDMAKAFLSANEVSEDEFLRIVGICFNPKIAASADGATDPDGYKADLLKAFLVKNKMDSKNLSGCLKKIADLEENEMRKAQSFLSRANIPDRGQLKFNQKMYSEYLRSQEISVEDFIEVQNLFFDQKSRETLAKDFIESHKDLAVDEFMKFLQYVSRDSQSKAAQSFAQSFIESNKDLTVDEFTKVLQYVSHYYSVSTAVQSFIESNKDLAVDGFKKVLQYVSHDSRSTAAQSFIESNKDLTVDGFKKVLDFLKPSTDSEVSILAQSFIESHTDSLSVDEFTKVLQYVSRDSRSNAAQSFIESHKDLAVDEFTKVLQYVSDYSRSKAAQSFIESHKDLAVDEFAKVLQYVSDYPRSNAAQSFIESRKDLAVDEFTKVLQYVSHDSRSTAAQSFIESNKDLTVVDFMRVIQYLPHESQIKLIKKSHTDSLDVDDLDNLIKILTAANGVTPDIVNLVVISFIETHEKDLSVVDFMRVIQYLPHESQIKLIKKSNKDLNADDFAKIIQHYDYASKNELRAFFFIKSHKDLNADDFAKIIQHYDYALKNELLVFFIKSNPEISAENIANILKVSFSDIFSDGVRKIEAMSKLIIEVEDGKKISDVITASYPNNWERFDYLRRAINLIAITPSTIPAILSVASEAIKTMGDEEVIEEAINFLQDRHIITGEKKVLDLLKNHYKSTYSTLATLLDVNIEDAVKEEAKKYLQGLLGEEFDSSQYSLMDIFSYHELSRTTDSFFALLKEEFVEKLRQNFQLPEAKAYFSYKEYDVMKRIIGDKLVNVGAFSSYLHDRKMRVPELNEAETAEYKLSFDNIVICRADHDAVNLQFVQLLGQDSCDDDKIIDFFDNFYAEGEFAALISGGNRQKIIELFKANKKEFAHLFKQKDGLASFICEVVAVGDGCLRNISNKFKSILNTKLMATPEDVEIYACFINDIFVPIANARGRDIMHSSQEDDPLTNSDVNNCKFNAVGFFDKIKANLKRDADSFDKFKDKMMGDFAKQNQGLKEWLDDFQDGDKKSRAISHLIAEILEDDNMRNEHIYDQFRELVAFHICRELFNDNGLANDFGVEIVSKGNEIFAQEFSNALSRQNLAELKKDFDELEVERDKQLKSEVARQRGVTEKEKEVDFSTTIPASKVEVATGERVVTGERGVVRE